MDIGKNLQASFDLYTKNFGTLFVAGLVAGLLSIVTIGILAGPLMSGFITLVKKIQRGEKGELNDIFANFSMTGSMILLTVFLWVYAILACIPILGMIIGLVVGPIVGIAMVAVAGLVAEKSKTVPEGLQFVMDKAKANFLQFWVYGFVFGLISGIGAILCGIGVLLTMPLGMIGMVFAYQNMTDESETAAPPTAGASV